jgi:hypothetical protein
VPLPGEGADIGCLRVPKGPHWSGIRSCWGRVSIEKSALVGNLSQGVGRLRVSIQAVAHTVFSVCRPYGASIFFRR